MDVTLPQINQLSCVILSKKPVTAAPMPNVSAQVQTNTRKMSSELFAMRALTPVAGMRMTMNAKVRPRATPMAPWLAISSISAFASGPVLLRMSSISVRLMQVSAFEQSTTPNSNQLVVHSRCGDCLDPMWALAHTGQNRDRPYRSDAVSWSIPQPGYHASNRGCMPSDN